MRRRDGAIHAQRPGMFDHNIHNHVFMMFFYKNTGIFKLNVDTSSTYLVFCSQRERRYSSKVDIYAAALVAVLIFARPRAITATVIDARDGRRFPDEMQGGEYSDLVSFVRCVGFESLFFSETFLINFKVYLITKIVNSC